MKKEPLHRSLKSVLFFLIYIGLYLRVADLFYMEFKGDEDVAMTMAIENARGFIKLIGLHSSIGLPNPPIFIYLLSIPALFTHHPVIVGAFIATLNVIGIIFLFIFLFRHLGEEIAYWATALFASAPWTILYARKIWAQDLLFPFIICLYFILFSNIEKYRPIKIVGFFMLLAIITQLHMSAWFLPFPLIIFFLTFRVHMRWKDVLMGVGAFLLFYIPYFIFLWQSQFNFRDFLHDRSSSVSHFWEHIVWAVSISSAERLDYVLGRETKELLIGLYHLEIAEIILQFYIICIFGVLLAALYYSSNVIKRAFSSKILSLPPQIITFFTLVFFLIPACYYVFHVPVQPHYLIVLYPSVTVLVTYFLLTYKKSIGGKRFGNIVVPAFLLLVAIAQLSISISLQAFIKTKPHEIQGDYGQPFHLHTTQWDQKFSSLRKQLN